MSVCFGKRENRHKRPDLSQQGLWLIPLGLLIMRCDFFPRLLGVCSIVGGAGYLLGSGASLIMPGLMPLALISKSSGVAIFPQLGEVPFIFWVIIGGIRLPWQAPSVNLPGSV